MERGRLLNEWGEVGRGGEEIKWTVHLVSEVCNQVQLTRVISFNSKESVKWGLRLWQRYGSSLQQQYMIAGDRVTKGVEGASSGSMFILKRYFFLLHTSRFVLENIISSCNLLAHYMNRIKVLKLPVYYAFQVCFHRIYLLEQ